MPFAAYCFVHSADSPASLLLARGWKLVRVNLVVRSFVAEQRRSGTATNIPLRLLHRQWSHLATDKRRQI